MILLFFSFFPIIQCLNKDGVEIRLSVSYQYRIKANELEEIILQFRDYDKFKNILEYVGKCREQLWRVWNNDENISFKNSLNRIR